MADRIRILYDGKLALTTAQFAEKHGLNMDTARKTLSRLGVDSLPDQLDGRTKLWPAALLDRAMKARPGKGAPGQPKPHVPRKSK